MAFLLNFPTSFYLSLAHVNYGAVLIDAQNHDLVIRQSKSEFLGDKPEIQLGRIDSEPPAYFTLCDSLLNSISFRLLHDIQADYRRNLGSNLGHVIIMCSEFN